MSDIDKRLRDAFDKVAVCRCGNGIEDGCCDNHNPSWNPCPDSQLLYDARAEIARLRSVCREAVSKLDDDVYPLLERGGTARCLLAKITCILADAGKEPSDGV